MSGSASGETSLDAARAVLRRYWGYESFREHQRDVLASVLAGEDVVAIMPTGSGKSICYQVPALLDEGLTLVISPLIALMQDQVEQLTERGVPAAYINSTLPHHAIDQRWTDAEFGRYRLLYVAPERLQSDLFEARAERLPIQRIAVDEAHCVSEWGHHFRPAYRQIGEVRDRLGGPPMLAVTATATPEVRRDMLELLGLRAPAVHVHGFDRPNIIWSIFREANKPRTVRDVLDGVPGSGLIYVATRSNAEWWAERLQDDGVSAAAYHAGLSTARRAVVQQEWLSGAVRIVCATNAFGMGIDKPDVRFVIHADLPGSLEAYYQEAGRAGRDGRTAYAVLLYQPADAETQQALIATSHPEASDLRAVYDAICNLCQVPVGAQPEDPLVPNLDAVVRLTGRSRSVIDTAVQILEEQGVWRSHPVRRNHGLIRFEQSPDRVRSYAHGLDNQALSRFVLDVLRIVHADAFRGWWDIDLRRLERRTAVDRARLLRGLSFLQERGLIKWRGPDDGRRIELLTARAARLPIDDLTIRRDQRRAERRLADMQRYARSVTCRRRFLLSYFGEQSPARCGRCDVCLGRHAAVTITPDDEPLLRRILLAVDDGQSPMAPEAVPAEEDRRRHQALVDWLVQEQYLDVKNPLDEEYRLTDQAYRMLEQWAPRTE
ncbi:MAG: RecQ family ATP-dependent DNA helicase [Bacteroidetes bacterium]|jgi:ATP-dependent DNA helicase RecQ|nr:RecQ family ATP-dependent DNA helicase [Bacteroidota bacterium]